MPNIEETLQTARRDLENLEDFLRANPSLESEIRTSMAETFATILAMESMNHPELFPLTDFITNLTVSASIFGYRKALEDNPLIRGGK